jgi:CubicO group peptidase (beta-lactamase class C family)
MVVTHRESGRNRRHRAMSLGPPSVLAIACVATALSFAPRPAAAQASLVPSEAGPRYRDDGKDADAYGRNEGYPACIGMAYFREDRCRVGALSHFDTVFPARVIAAPETPSVLARAASEPSISYTFEGQTLTLDQYLERQPVTGFLIAKGDTILVERYQYARTDKHRLTSFSMAKTITALLIGIALKDGAIRSIDDLAEIYVPDLKGTEYGRTPIKALLQMSSGVAFSEMYWDTASDIWTLSRLTIQQGPEGSLQAVKRFNRRYAQPGQRFQYAAAESLVLGLVLAGATARKVSDYAREKLWEPLGAEADASWGVDATGQEVTYAFFNAVLRDWARLGLMLAHDGTWNGKRIVPREWLLAATSIAPADSHLKLGGIWSGYGYQIWLLPGGNRMFALRGLHGQFVLVDPETKLVLVQTAVHYGGNQTADQELLALWAAVSSELR